MLSSMRNAAQGVVGKAIMTVVMGLIIVSFVIWGVGDMLRGFTASTVASVGGAKISSQEYHDAYQRTVQQYQRQLRQPFTNEQARAIGLDRQVLQRLISEAAIDDEAGKLGLNISDDALRNLITSNPAFQDKSGAFDPQRFVSVLVVGSGRHQVFDRKDRDGLAHEHGETLALLCHGCTPPPAGSAGAVAPTDVCRSVD